MLFLLPALLLGLALAQRPVNVPNYLLVTSPVLEVDVPIDGELSGEDGQNFKDGSYLDIYTFKGEAGQLVAIDVTSFDFDTTLTLYSPSGILEQFNDDNDFSTDSTISVELFETGSKAAPRCGGERVPSEPQRSSG